MHRETFLNIKLNINNEKQDYKIETVYVRGGARGGGRVNEGN
jgi:hypothetical protein